MNLQSVKKRDGKIVPFEKEKIITAIFKAAQAVGGKDYQTASELGDKVDYEIGRASCRERV